MPWYIWRCKQRHASRSRPLILFQLPLDRKLSWYWCSLCFHHRRQKAQQSCCYQGTKVKPSDCVVIAERVYLPVLHHYSAFICTPHCQRKGLSFESDGTAESEHWFLSQTDPQSCGARLALEFSDTLMSEKAENNVDYSCLNLKHTFLKFTTTLKPLTD